MRIRGWMPAGLAPGDLAPGGPRRPSRCMHACLLAQAPVLVGRTSSVQPQPPAPLASAVGRAGGRRGVRARPRLRALRAAGGRRRARRRERPPTVRRWHRWPQPPGGRRAATQQRGAPEHQLRRAEARVARDELRLGVPPNGRRHVHRPRLAFVRWPGHPTAHRPPEPDRHCAERRPGRPLVGREHRQRRGDGLPGLPGQRPAGQRRWHPDEPQRHDGGAGDDPHLSGGGGRCRRP